MSKNASRSGRQRASDRPVAEIRFERAVGLCRWMVSTLAAMVLLSPPAAAELQRVEAMGSYGIHEATRSSVIPRDKAIEQARWEGVSRVALALVGEAAPNDGDDIDGGVENPGDPSDDQVAALREALGNDVLPYMRSYRILDDRGEVPVFFNEDPDVSVEYVVVVEVLVDVDRVTSALEEAGLIEGGDAIEGGEAIAIELLGLSRYEGFQFLLDALREDFGATRVRTIEFSRKRQVLLVEGPFGPSALSTRLARLESPQLVLEPTGVDSVGRRIRVMARWFPGSAEDAGADSAGN